MAWLNARLRLRDFLVLGSLWVWPIPEALEAPQSYRLQPTPSSPIYTRSAGEHCTILQAGLCDELVTGPRVGHNKWAVTGRAKKPKPVARRQSPTKLRTTHVQTIQPFTALLQQAHHRVGFYGPQLKIKITGLTISRCEKHLESRSGQGTFRRPIHPTRSPIPGPYW